MMITLHSKYCGRLDVDESEGFAEYVTVALNNEKRTVWLNIFGDVLPNTPVDKVIALLDSLPACTEVIRNVLTQKKGTNVFVDEFIEFHLDELDTETLQSLNITPPTHEACANQLTLRGVHMWIVAPAPGTLKMTLDYGVPEDVSDELLVFNFDEHGELLDITWES
ncbi:DUF2004 domain-containing protein [Escherichia albertii]|uniref:DUF2004 domain-containing protein n=1 Tax=Escherichia albertii TaxID=208962 RepID=UPI000743A39A|nr:DUF2004 domain-containing protein [Escherichia albertii]WDB78704.1 DUF2004 domain-containing protein [Escherichia albertii]